MKPPNNAKFGGSKNLADWSKKGDSGKPAVKSPMKVPAKAGR